MRQNERPPTLPTPRPIIHSERDRDDRVQRHIEAADEAVEQARRSIQEVRKLMGFPFARSVRIEPWDDSTRLDGSQ